MSGYPWGPLSDEVAAGLSRLLASFDTFSGWTLHPAAATLRDGTEHPAVLFVRLSPDEGAWAEELERAGRCLHPEQVVAVRESPIRLPALLANRLYEAGAATQREYLFHAVTKDGQRFTARAEQVVDFISLPEPHQPEHLAEVYPVESAAAEDAVLSTVPFRWCFYIWPRLPGDPEE